MNYFNHYLLMHQKKRIVLNPSSTLTDFERGIINDVFLQKSIKGCHFHYAQNIWRKIKTYNLVTLSKQENIRRQIANIIELPIIPANEVNNCMGKIIDELSNYSQRLGRLTGYIIKNYIENAPFSLNIWNHFDTVGERPRTSCQLDIIDI